MGFSFFEPTTSAASPPKPYTYPGSGSLPSGSRGVPEAINLNDLHGPGFDFGNVAENTISVAAKTPGYVYERPVAFVNEATKFGGSKGLIDEALAAVRSVPIVGDVLQGASNVLTASGQLVPSLINSVMASNLKNTAGQPDDQKLDPLQSILITDNFFNLNATVGDLRHEAAIRGFSSADINDLVTGRKGIYDYPDRAISTNQITDIAGRLALDPSNLLLGAGLLGKLPKATDILSKIIPGGAQLAQAVGSTKALGTLDALQALRAGTIEGVTLSDLGRHVAMISRGVSDAASAYRKAAVTLTAGQLSLEAADWMMPDNTPISNALEPLFSAAKALEHDTPLSNGQLFDLFSAFKFPLRQTVGKVWSDTRAHGLGVGITNPFEAPSTAFHGVKTDFLARRNDIFNRVVKQFAPELKGSERTAKVYSMFGDAGHFMNYVAHLMLKQVEPHIPGILVADRGPGTTQAFQLHLDNVQRIFEEALPDLVQHGHITGRSTAQMAEDWFQGERSKAMPDIKRPWDAEQAAREWLDWERENQPLADFGRSSPLVIGIMDGLLPKEHILGAKTMFAAAADGTTEIKGKTVKTVSAARAHDIIEKYPALYAKKNDPVSFFGRMRSPDHPAIPIPWIMLRLTKLQNDAATIRDYLHKREELDAREEKLARKTGKVTDAYGNPDPARAPDMGQAGIVAETLTNQRARALRMPMRTVDQTLAARGTANVRAFEDNIAKHYDNAGFNLENATQGISIQNGHLSPAVSLVLDPKHTDPQGMLEAIAASLRAQGRTGPQSATGYYIGTEALSRWGVERNGFSWRWDYGGVSPEARNGIVAAIQSAFPRAYVNDTAGIVQVLLKDGEIPADFTRQMVDHTMEVYTGNHISVDKQPAWIQVVGNDLRGHRGGPLRPDHWLTDIERRAAGSGGLATRYNGFRLSLRDQNGPPLPRTGFVGDERRGTAPSAPVSGSVGEQRFFHGASQPLTVLQEVGGRQAENLFGPGFYVTDNPRVAGSYTRKNAGGQPTIHEVTWQGQGEPRILDLTTELPPTVLSDVTSWLEQQGIGELDLSSVRTGEDLYAAVKRGLADSGWSRTEAGGLLESLNGKLGEHFDALRYQGGTRTGGVRHEAMVLLHPEEWTPRTLDEQPGLAPTPPIVHAEDVANYGGNTGHVLFLAGEDTRLAGVTPQFDVHSGAARVTEGLAPEQLAKAQEIEVYNRRFNPTYQLKATPQYGRPYYAGQGNAVLDMVTGKLAAGDTMRYALTSRVADFQHALFGRVYTRRLSEEARTELQNIILSRTADITGKDAASIGQIDEFLASLAGAARNSRLFGGQLWRNGDALPPGMTNDIATGQAFRDKASTFQGFSPAVVERIGAGDFYKILDQASSRFYRRVAESARTEKGQLGHLINLYHGNESRLSGTISATYRPGHYIKAFYHIFRFLVDPRWHIMNHLEASIIGLAKWGLAATRIGGQLEAGQADPGMLVHGHVSRGGLVGAEEDLLANQLASGTLDRRKLQGYIGASFKEGRFNSAKAVLLQMAHDDPAIRALRENFGGTPEGWVKGIDRMLYEFDNQGVESAIHAWAKENLSNDDLRAMEPLLQQIYKNNQQIYEDVVSSFHGNTNRSNLERIANSYFLFWPISYQLKAAKVLLDVLTKQAGGSISNFGGVYVLNNLLETHKRLLLTDPVYAKALDDHPELWRVAAMLLPITPFDLGVGLGKFTDYTASAVGAALGFWDTDKSKPQDPIQFAGRIMNMGVPYTLDLLGRLYHEILPTKRQAVSRAAASNALERAREAQAAQP